MHESDEFKVVGVEVPRQPDKPLSDRVDDLFAAGAEHLEGPSLGQFARLVCDGCGANVQLDPEHAELPEDWISTLDGDFCPRCANGR